VNLDVLLKNEKRVYKKQISTARKAILLCILACVLALILQLVISFLPFPTDSEVSEALSNMVIYCIFMTIPFALLWVCFRFFFKNVDTHLVKRYLPKKPFLFIAGTLGIGYITNITISSLFPGFVERYALEGSPNPETVAGIILMYISNAILPAILEEWAFRGVICKNLLPYGKKGAILISSLLFGIMHINPSTVIFTTVIGIMLAICYEHTGSLAIPMVIHFLNNAIATTITLFIDENDTESLIMIIPILLVFALIGFGIYAIIHYNKYGIAQKSVSLIKPNVYGYKLPLAKAISCTIFNAGIIPLAAIYYFYYYILYLYN